MNNGNLSNKFMSDLVELNTKIVELHDDFIKKHPKEIIKFFLGEAYDETKEVYANFNEDILSTYSHEICMLTMLANFANFQLTFFEDNFDISCCITPSANLVVLLKNYWDKSLKNRETLFSLITMHGALHRVKEVSGFSKGELLSLLNSTSFKELLEDVDKFDELIEALKTAKAKE